MIGYSREHFIPPYREATTNRWRQKNDTIKKKKVNHNELVRQKDKTKRDLKFLEFL